MAKRQARRSSSARRKSRNAEERYYIDGNTVRKTAPKRKSKKKQTVKISEPIPERPKRLFSMSAGYVVFLVFSLLISAAVCIWYVRLRSELTASQKEISRLETTYNALKQSNDEEYDRIMASVDLESIKKRAMTEYGMKYPKEDQVVNISGADDDYVRQYGDIPKK